MANGWGNNKSNGWGNGRNGHGRGDPDFDRRPGNSNESPSYARKYDPRSETEYTNLPEVRDQLDAIYKHPETWTFQPPPDQVGRRRRVRKPLNKQEWPDVGPFIIPERNSWAAHAQIVRDNSNKLDFDPAAFPLFDGIIAKNFGKRALYDPSARNYEKYEGLRTNLEVMRNDIMGMYLNDGSYDKGDEIYVPKVATIADALGKALAHDTWLKRPFTRSISVDLANQPGVGAAHMYNYLLDIQEQPGWFTGIKHSIKNMLHVPFNDWNLPPIEATPYSQDNLSAPATLTPAAPEPAGKSFVESLQARTPSPATRGV